MQADCDHERGAGAHYAAISYAANARRSCAFARAHGGAGHEPSVDAAGNLRGLWQPGRRRNKRLMLGSHIDTVPDAGAFDGVLGVTLALEWVGIAQELNLPLNIEVIAFSEEEGVRLACRFWAAAPLPGDSTAAARCERR
jgi:acetylornithine deacetylase/succinyl-diaminopimelate desuccinylase-like protein